MKNIQFPLCKTKAEGAKEKFDLTSPQDRQAYFELKAGPEIKKLQDFLKENTFICYLLGKKNSGKGTYAKMFQEIVSKDKIEHFSIGDMVRTLDEVVQDKSKLEELINFLKKNYRGFMPLDELVQALKERSTKVLLPSELVLALVKMKISTDNKKALFIDGFPRNLDQVSYSLFFRDLVGYRDDPDVFCLIDVPEAVIDERIKYRAVCPNCQTSRNLKLLPTSNVKYDEAKNEFFLVCDNPACSGKRMTAKEGDEFGIEPIRERLKVDEELMGKAFSLHGIPKILLRNSVPTEKANDYLDDYEITPEFVYSQQDGQVKIQEKPWVIKDDEGADSYSLMPPPVVVSLIKQMAEVLGL